MNIEIRAKDSFVHGTLTMNKREERAVPEAVATSLINAGLAEKVVKQRVQRAPAAATAKNAPKPQNKMAPASANKTSEDGGQQQLPTDDAAQGSADVVTGASVVVRDATNTAS